MSPGFPGRIGHHAPVAPAPSPASLVDSRYAAFRLGVTLALMTIGASVMKTGRVAIVEQTTRGASLGALIADEIQRRYFDYLDQPVQRVTGRWAPPTVSQALERAALASEDDIRTRLAAMLQESGLTAQPGNVHALRA